MSSHVEVTQVISTLGECMALMAPSLGGSIPKEDSEEYSQWRLFIQLKQEEAARRGFWRRLLHREDLSLTAEDEEVLLPIRFQRANALYILYVDEVDLGDPDRIPDEQGIFAQVDNELYQVDGVTPNTNFGRWKLSFSTPIEETQTAPFWYFATPPKPVASTDKLLLPGDMIAYGALSEVFRTNNLEGSQDDARIEYENRLTTYLAMEMIPARHELLHFVTNPSITNRTAKARSQYSQRLNRVYRG